MHSFAVDILTAQALVSKVTYKVILGHFINGKLNGSGTMFTKDNIIYKGDFLEGIRHGIGKESTKYTYYEGSFENNRKHGKGKLIHKVLEEVYEGDFKEDSITGFGSLLWKNGDRYIGEVSNKKMHGMGKYFWSDGSEYEGEYIDNIKVGKGIFKWNNGNIFEGPFDKGLPHGQGIIKTKGLKYECEFREGRLFRKGDLIDN